MIEDVFDVKVDPLWHFLPHSLQQYRNRSLTIMGRREELRVGGQAFEGVNCRRGPSMLLILNLQQFHLAIASVARLQPLAAKYCYEVLIYLAAFESCVLFD